jgi:2-amino-4-hydroxy-6-hydroxymethyldihydropteridine diphosphokinase
MAGLRSLLDDVRDSAVYETRPLHLVKQPDFLNACCTGVSRLTPVRLLSSLQSLERVVGRKPGGPRFGPRVLDLDILLYGDQTVDDPDLTIPHARLRDRAFVLIPLAELAADWVVPAGRDAPAATVGDLAAAIDTRGVRRTDIHLDNR